MIGTITNCCTILAGSVIGATLHTKELKNNIKKTMMNGSRLSCISTRYQ